MSFGEFAKARGASKLSDLPDHVEAFVQAWIRDRMPRRCSASRRRQIGKEVRNPIGQLLRLAVPGYIGLGRPHKPDNPFERQAPQFLSYLVEEKGLRASSLRHYRFHLRQFAAYLQRIGIEDLARLSPIVLSGFVAEYAPPRVAWTTLRNACGTLRVFLRYLHREGVIAKDLSSLVEFPQSYRHAGIPRSISWEQVEQVLASIDRRCACGKRDYAPPARRLLSESSVNVIPGGPSTIRLVRTIQLALTLPPTARPSVYFERSSVVTESRKCPRR